MASQRTRLAIERIDGHHLVCNLVSFDYPLLQLFTDGKHNWIYLWCDTLADKGDLWLIVSVSRKLLLDYLKQKTTLRRVIEEAVERFALEIRVADDAAPKRRRRERARTARDLGILVPRRTRRLAAVELADIEQYMPSADSYFDESLSSEIDIESITTPKTFSVPIAGSWFSQDFFDLFARYENVYAFFYATQPQFVKTISHHLERLLRSPWKGGYSRVNLYSHLARRIPGIHALKVHSVQYASPGEVSFDSVAQIGDSIDKATIALVAKQSRVESRARGMRRILSANRLNKRDLSSVSDKGLRNQTGLSEEDSHNLEKLADQVGEALGVENEFRQLRTFSPNVVVYCKAVLSFLRQLGHLADLERQQLLAFNDD